MESIAITDMPGIKIGHAENLKAATGCTVIICEKGAVGGVDVRGGSPGTRDTDALNPVNNRKEIHAVFLSGGSSFGLDAAGGVMKFLEDHNIGRDVGVTCIPNVCGAILFDLKCGSSVIRPDAEMGYNACVNAFSKIPAEGSVGAGTGAIIGTSNGTQYAMKGGIGSIVYKNGDLIVGAVVAVNCVGDIVDSNSGRIIAGALNKDKKTFACSEDIILSSYLDMSDIFSGNTIIGCVFSNADFNKDQATKLASVCHDGIARAVRPAHSMYDGDTIFTMCTGAVKANFDAAAILAAKSVEEAIRRAVMNADSLGGYISFKDLNKNTSLQNCR
ncbi:MAG: P1 family peptidase [Bacillota bacterium]|nr:P1 family peptidase [Bacillota bacterium]